MNSRLDNLHAAILDFKLSKYNLDIDRRREIASIYQTGLNDVKGNYTTSCTKFK